MTSGLWMFKLEFPPGQPWFANLDVRLDLGFSVLKRLRRQDARPSAQETEEAGANVGTESRNKLLAGERIVVEHSIAGLKRYRILADRLRMHDLTLHNQGNNSWVF